MKRGDIVRVVESGHLCFGRLAVCTDSFPSSARVPSTWGKAAPSVSGTYCAATDPSTFTSEECAMLMALALEGDFLD